MDLNTRLGQLSDRFLWSKIGRKLSKFYLILAPMVSYSDLERNKIYIHYGRENWVFPRNLVLGVVLYNSYLPYIWALCNSWPLFSRLIPNIRCIADHRPWLITSWLVFYHSITIISYWCTIQVLIYVSRIRKIAYGNQNCKTQPRNTQNSNQSSKHRFFKILHHFSM